MQVSGREYQLLNEVLVDSFSLGELDRMLAFDLGMRLDTVVGYGGSRNTTVFELIAYFNRRDQVELLVQAARHFNPTNQQLYEVAQSLGRATQVSAHTASGLSPIEAGSFEKFVQRNFMLMTPTEMRVNMMRVEGQLCVVELKQRGGRGEALGSGFLVGPKAVLTNYHVVRDVLEGDDIQSLQVRFDAEPQKGIIREKDEGTVFDVKEVPVSSPYTKGDGRNLEGPPAEDELDFTILLLNRDAGASMVGGRGDQKESLERGYIEMPPQASLLKEGDPLIIYQYPGGRELMMAIDTDAVVGTAWDGMRLRYRNNTEKGSSGSPVFDMDWDLVALHQSGGMEKEYIQFNQGVPINLIRDYVEDQGKGDLFGE